MLLLEDDVKALEEMYPQGEKVMRCAFILGRLKSYFSHLAKVILLSKLV